MPRFEWIDPKGGRHVIDARDEDEAWQKAAALKPIEYPTETVAEARAAAAREETGNPLAIGAGRLVDTAAAGLKQAALETANRISPSERLRQELSRLAEEQAANTVAYKGYQQRFPVETALGEAAPYSVMSGGPLGLAAKIGTVEAMRYGNPQERAARGVLGAGGGFASGMVSNVLGGYINPPLTSVQREALTQGRKLGIQPRLSQATQSPFVESVEDAIAQTPGGRGVMADFARANQVAQNRAAARAMGGEADETGQLSSMVFANTKQKLGLVYEAIKNVGKKAVRLNKGVERAADEIISSQSKLGSKANQSLLSLAKEAKQAAGSNSWIDGEAYQLWHSKLTDESYSAFRGGDSTTGQAYQKLMRALDDAADFSLRRSGLSQLADDLKEVRPLYANFKLLTKGRTVIGGDVNPSRVAQVLATSNPDTFKTRIGGDDLATIAKYAEAFPALRPGSQTYGRTVLSNPVASAVLAGPAYIGGKIATAPAVTYIPSRLGGTRAGAMIGPLAKYGTRFGALGMFRRLMEPQTP